MIGWPDGICAGRGRGRTPAGPDRRSSGHLEQRPLARGLEVRHRGLVQMAAIVSSWLLSFSSAPRPSSAPAERSGWCGRCTGTVSSWAAAIRPMILSRYRSSGIRVGGQGVGGPFDDLVHVCVVER